MGHGEDESEESGHQLPPLNEGLVASVAIHILRQFYLGHCWKSAGKVEFRVLAVSSESEIVSGSISKRRSRRDPGIGGGYIC